MKIDREQLIAEELLRKNIRKAIKIVRTRQKIAEKKELREEKELRGIIRQLLIEGSTPDPEEAPHENTGINVLKDLLKKIVPIIASCTFIISDSKIIFSYTN